MKTWYWAKKCTEIAKRNTFHLAYPFSSLEYFLAKGKPNRLLNTSIPQKAWEPHNRRQIGYKRFRKIPQSLTRFRPIQSPIHFIESLIQYFAVANADVSSFHLPPDFHSPRPQSHWCLVLCGFCGSFLAPLPAFRYMYVRTYACVVGFPIPSDCCWMHKTQQLCWRFFSWL